MFPISTGYSTSLFNGDLVGFASGALTSPQYNGNSTSASAGYGIGAFVGCEYSTSSSTGGQGPGPIYGRNRFQYWQASTNAQDAVGYVVDDPRVYFRVAVLQQAPVNSTSAFSIADVTSNTIGYLSPAFVNTNVAPVSGAGGNTTTGDSSMAVTAGNPLGTSTSWASGNFRSTATLPMRVIQLVPDTAVTVTTTTASTISSGVVTLTSATGVQPGMQAIINGYTGCLPGNNVFVQYVNGSTIKLNTPASVVGTIATPTCSAPSGTTITFVGYPEVIVGWNFGFHDYEISAGL
jgi:hypothetical protein